MCTTAERELDEMFLQISMERPGMGEWDTCMTRPDRGCVVVTMSFNVKIDLADFECNLKD